MRERTGWTVLRIRPTYADPAARTTPFGDRLRVVRDRESDTPLSPDDLPVSTCVAGAPTTGRTIALPDRATRTPCCRAAGTRHGSRHGVFADRGMWRGG